MFVFSVCCLFSRRCHNIPNWFWHLANFARLASQPAGFFRLCRSKNSLGDGLNVLKQKLFVKTKQGIDDYRFKSSMLSKKVRP